MTKDKIGQLRISFLSDIMQGFFILQVGHIAAGMRVTQGAAIDAGFAVAQMVVGKNNIAGLIEFANHMQITTGMLAVAVNQLDYALGFT